MKMKYISRVCVFDEQKYFSIRNPSWWWGAKRHQHMSELDHLMDDHNSTFYYAKRIKIKKRKVFFLKWQSTQRHTAMKSFKRRIYDCKNMQTILLNCGWAAPKDCWRVRRKGEKERWRSHFCHTISPVFWHVRKQSSSRRNRD